MAACGPGKMAFPLRSGLATRQGKGTPWWCPSPHRAGLWQLARMQLGNEAPDALVASGEAQVAAQPRTTSLSQVPALRRSLLTGCAAQTTASASIAKARS